MESRRIAVIEDEQTIAAAVAARLRTEGYDVEVAHDGPGGVELVRRFAPDLVALATDYADEGVRLLGINGTDDAGTAQAFERTFDVPYPSIADTDGQAVASLQGSVPLQAVPTTVVLDREGRVAARVLGLAEGSTLRAMVDDVLAEPAHG